MLTAHQTSVNLSTFNTLFLICIEPTLKPSTAPPIRRWRALYYCRTALLPSLPFLQRSWGVLLPWALLPPQLADQSLPVPGTHSCSCRSVFIPQPGLPPKHK